MKVIQHFIIYTFILLFLPIAATASSDKGMYTIANNTGKILLFKEVVKESANPLFATPYARQDYQIPPHSVGKFKIVPRNFNFMIAIEDSLELGNIALVIPGTYHLEGDGKKSSSLWSELGSEVKFLTRGAQYYCISTDNSNHFPDVTCNELN